MNRQELEALQPQLVQRFQRILAQNRLGHAYLFSGRTGTLSLAILLSQTIFCQQQQDYLACGHCRSCRLIAQGEFSDVTLIEPQGQTIKTERIRELVRQFSQSGFESSQQVFIIREAEKMHPNAANSLLKVMEEPQASAYLFLLTNQEELVLATIKSRTQLIQFPKQTTYLQHMLEEEGLLKDQAQLLAQLAGASQEAKKLANQQFFLDLLTPSRQFIHLLLAQPEQAFLQVGKLLVPLHEKADQERFLDLLGLLLSESLPNPQVLRALKELARIRQLWRSNVSLQHCLEYLTLQLTIN